MLSRILYTTLILIPLSVLTPQKAGAQCTNAQINWDNLDYYWNSGASSSTPYSNYIDDAKEQTQRFGFGPIMATIANSDNTLIAPGAGNSAENANHTGEVANYTGMDVQYNPSANGRFITITFSSPVTAPNFTLYDVDDDAVFTITATNNLNAATTVNITTYASTIISVTGSATSRVLTASNSNQGNSSNRATATVAVPGLVNSIRITITTRGDNPEFWLSDINGCVPGSFTPNWHQLANNRPFWGPTQSQAEYFLVTPDNNSVYMINATTAEARLLFTDPSRNYVNSFAYDPYNKYLYYIAENSSINANNKELKRYDYETETYSTLVANITTTLGIPTFNMGIESAGAAFYDGALYLGIEGGTQSSGSSLRTRETIIWRIDFDGSHNPISACQVFAADAATNGSGSSSIHDWGDFIIKNGVIYDFNTARNGSMTPNYSQSKYHHFNMMTGQAVTYSNPGTSSWNGQAAMGWSGQLYYFRDNGGSNSCIGNYNEAGVNGATRNIFVTAGPAWPGGAGDASDPIRPKCDFGDAPASYDPYVNPATQSPAVHERADTMWLGTTTSEATSWSREYDKRGVNGIADSDNGIPTVHILQPGLSDYLVQVSLYNNSSSNATVMAWLDYNANGVFDPSEAAQIIPAGPIAPGAGVQTRWLYWPTINTLLPSNSSTYLRVRITSAAAGMTGNHPTGYFLKGEVEDYEVVVDNYPLASHLLNFDAIATGNTVKLKWNATEDAGMHSYVIERSQDNNDWTAIDTVSASGIPGQYAYQAVDENPLKGESYYRLRIIEAAGMNRFSAVQKVSIDGHLMTVRLAPNPAVNFTTLQVESPEAGELSVQLVNMLGNTLLNRNYKIKAGMNKLELSFNGMVPPGTYIVRINKGEFIIQEKLIIK